jgi:hypothetical protein
MSTVRIQVRRGTASQWTSVNPILAAGEMGVESDTNLFKFGNGSSTWTALAYANNSDVAIGEISQDAINSALSMGSGLTKTYDDGANTISIAVDASYFNELAQDAVNTALTAGTGITKTYNDTANTLTVAVDTSVIANKTYVDNAVTGLANTAATDYVLQADLGQPNGVATLNASTKIPTSQIDTDIIALKSYVNSQDSTTLTSAQSYTNTAISNLVNGAPGALDTLSELATALGNDASYAATITNALALKSPIASPTFTGTVTLPADTAIGNVSKFEIEFLDGVTSNIQTQINSANTAIGYKAPIASPTLTGTVTLPATTSVGTVSATEIAYLDGVTSSIQDQIDTKAPLSGPTFTGTVTLPASTSIGDVSNLEIGYLDGTSSNLQIQINAKAPAASPTFTGTVTLPASTSIGDVSNVELGYVNGVTSGIQNQIDAKAPLANAVFTGTFEAPVGTITGTMLANGTVSSANIVDGTIATIDLADGAVTSAKIADGTIATADIADSAITTAKIADGTIVDGDINASAGIAKTKISGTAVTLSDTGTVTSTMLADGTIVDADINASAEIAQSKISGLSSSFALKADLASPTFTGTVSGITKSMVGLGSVDNTADADKPVSSATTTALGLKANLASPALTGTPTAPTAAAGTSTTQVATTAFVGTAVSNLVASAPGALDTLNELATALGNDASFSTTVTNSIALKAPIASPTFTGTATAPAITATGLITASASGIAFTDKTQTKAGVPSRTPIATTISASTTLAGSLQDNMVPLAGAVAITIGDASNALYAVGESVDFYQASGTGASFAKTGSVNLLYTPGALLRTTYSSATAQKVSSTDWLIYGDLKA